MARTLAHVAPKVLRWARESAGYALPEAAAHGGFSAEKLGRAERGETLLTLRQAERLADVYGRPLSLLFAPTPPEEPSPERQLRRLPGAPKLPWPPEMHLLSRIVAERQDAADLLYEELDESPPWPSAAVLHADDPQKAAIGARVLLGISLTEQHSWRDPKGYKGLAAWRDAVEALGVLVMQDGSMPVSTLRGFAALHPRVPVIVLNTKDDPRARVYTLIHELGHLVRNRAGRTVGSPDEDWCDDFAGSMLMPQEDFSENFRRASARSAELVALIDDLALRYGSTPAAAAVRVSIYGLAPAPELRRARQAIGERRSEPASPRGGDFYRNTVARLGPSFTRLVFEARGADAISGAGAAKLLNTKVDNLPKLDALVHVGAAGG